MAVASDTAELIRQARAWLAEDPDPETREELSALIEAEDTAALADRFGGMLQFGTAGLRGELGPGPLRMNRAVVIRAAAGLAAYLRKQAASSDGGPGLVVIGYDARYKSADFARDTAAVMTGAGLRAALLPRPLPTPSWPSPYGTWGRSPASPSRRATTRRATTATRCISAGPAAVRRSCPRPTRRSPPRSRRCGAWRT